MSPELACTVEGLGILIGGVIFSVLICLIAFSKTEPVDDELRGDAETEPHE